jgi:hypothetical protein
MADEPSRKRQRTDNFALADTELCAAVATALQEHSGALERLETATGGELSAAAMFRGQRLLLLHRSEDSDLVPWLTEALLARADDVAPLEELDLLRCMVHVLPDRPALAAALFQPARKQCTVARLLSLAVSTRASAALAVLTAALYVEHTGGLAEGADAVLADLWEAHCATSAAADNLKVRAIAGDCPAFSKGGGHIDARECTRATGADVARCRVANTLDSPRFLPLFFFLPHQLIAVSP